MERKQRRLIVDVFELVFYQNDRIALTSETLTDGNITVEVNETEVRGGRGNFRIATLHSGRDITVECNDPCFDYNTLALSLGQDVITESGIGYCMVRKYKVKENADGDFTFILEEIPKFVDTDLEMFYETVKIPADKYTYSEVDNSITLKSADFPKMQLHDVVTVNPYRYETDEDSEIINIDATTFAEGGKLVLETLEKDTKEKATARIQYVFPTAVMSGNFEVNTQSEVQASPTPLKFTVIKPEDSDEIGYIIRIPIKDKKENPITPTPVPSVLDLAGVERDSAIDVTFSPATGATAVKLQYKESSDLSYTDDDDVLDATSTSGSIIGLTNGTAYNVRLAFTVDGVEYYSNVITATPTL